eukprot:7377112-Prymnesium_polylepis.2
MVVGLNVFPQIDFAVVLLAPLGPGQTLAATDDAWRADVTPNAFADAEAHVTHTATSNEAAGTVLRMPDFAGRLQIQRDHGDQVIVYQGRKSNPTFICALDNSGGYTNQHCPASTGGWHQANCDAHTQGEQGRTYYSALPTGLSNGVDALAWTHTENWAYAGITTGSASKLRTAIAQRASWTSSDTTAQPFITSFS